MEPRRDIGEKRTQSNGGENGGREGRGGGGGIAEENPSSRQLYQAPSGGPRLGHAGRPDDREAMAKEK